MKCSDEPRTKEKKDEPVGAQEYAIRETQTQKSTGARQRSCGSGLTLPLPSVGVLGLRTPGRVFGWLCFKYFLCECFKIMQMTVVFLF